MAEELLTFQKIKDPEVAKDLEEKLSEAGIYFETETEDKFFDPSFSGDVIKREINIKISPSDFAKANKAMDEYYKLQVEHVGHDHYLFDFSDEELKEILAKSDEWGHLDYQLAQFILKERGKEVNTEMLESLKQRRKKELSKPEKSQHWLAIWGYFAVAISPFLNNMPRFAGFFLAIFIGWILSNGKRTLPDGDVVYMYGQSDRLQGKIIMVAGTLLLIAFYIFSLYSSGIIN